MKIENLIGSDFSGVISIVQNGAVMFRGCIKLFYIQNKAYNGMLFIPFS